MTQIIAIYFDADALRDHFAGTEREERMAKLTDEQLNLAADMYLAGADSLWAAFDLACVDILDFAEDIHV